MTNFVFLKDVFPDYNGLVEEESNLYKQDKIEKYKKEFLELKQKQYKQVQESRNNNIYVSNQLQQNPIQQYQHPSTYIPYIEHFTTPQIQQPQTSPIPITCEIFFQHMKNCKRCEYIYNNNSFYNNLIYIFGK